MKQGIFLRQIPRLDLEIVVYQTFEQHIRTASPINHSKKKIKEDIGSFITVSNYKLQHSNQNEFQELNDRYITSILVYDALLPFLAVKENNFVPDTTVSFGNLKSLFRMIVEEKPYNIQNPFQIYLIHKKIGEVNISDCVRSVFDIANECSNLHLKDLIKRKKYLELSGLLKHHAQECYKKIINPKKYNEQAHLDFLVYGRILPKMLGATTFEELLPKYQEVIKLHGDYKVQFPKFLI